MATETEIRARYEQIRAHLRRHVFIAANAEPWFVSVFCNRCGRIVVADSLESLLPKLASWSIGSELGDDDYCPNCL